MVTVKVPVVAELLAENVSVLVPVAGLGLKDAVVPLRKSQISGAWVSFLKAKTEPHFAERIASRGRTKHGGSCYLE